MIRRTQRIVLVAGVAILTSACSSIRSPGVPSNPWLGSTAACSGSDANRECTFSEAVNAVAKSQAYCMDLREYYERGGEVTGSQRLFVGIFGSLAGSVFAITAGGTAAKAWAGLSGATNGIQTQLDQSGRKSAPEAVEKIADVQLEFANGVATDFRQGHYRDVVQAAVLLPDRCSANAGLGLAKAGAEAAKAAASAASAASAADRAASAAQAAASAAKK